MTLASLMYAAVRLYPIDVFSEQSYKASTLVNYDLRVVSISNLLVIKTLECKMFMIGHNGKKIRRQSGHGFDTHLGHRNVATKATRNAEYVPIKSLN